MNKKSKFEIALFTILAIMGISLLALRIILAFSWLPETGGVSINVLYGIKRIMDGFPLYTSPEQAPFPIIQYMPLYFYFVKTIAGVLGLSDIHSLMVLNRSLCLWADMACTCIISTMLIRIFGMRTLPAWTLSLIYFVSIPAIIYGRADNLYLLFTISCISLTIRNLMQIDKNPNESPGLQRWILPGVLAGFSILTKQTGIFLCLFTGIFLILKLRNKRSVLAFSASAILVFAAGILVMHSGKLSFLMMNVMDGVKNGINTNWFAEVLLKNYFLKHSYLIALGILAAWLEMKNRKSAVSTFIGFGIAWYFIIATATSFKAGSGPNYYLEFIAMSLLGIGNLSLRYPSEIRRINPYAFILSPFFLLASANDKGWGDTRLMMAAKTDYQNCSEVTRYLTPRIGPSEWVMTGFHKENLLNIMLCDKALFPCREVAFYFTWPLGVFRFNEFQTLKEKGKIPFVIVAEGEQAGQYLNTEFNDYQKDTVIAGYQIYRKPY